MELLALVTSVYILCLVSQTECDNVSCGKVERPNMKFNLRSRGKYARFRCNKGYELLGHANAVCQSTGAWSVEIPRCIGPTCAAIPDTPGLVVESFKNGALLKFSCSTGKVRDGVDSIYCEDDKWSALPPVCNEGVSMGCDFEGGLCGWSQDSSDDFDWTRNRGETPTADTGPQVDHTTNSVHGHYLFAESSSPQEAGKKTRLISPIYNPDSVVGLCLEFYYHMFGPDGDGQVGQLDVYIKPRDTSPDKLTLKQQEFHKEGNQGDQWMKAHFEIPEEKQPFQIVFEATILNSWTSDIAIDDIRLHNCKEAKFDDVGYTPTTTPIPTTKVTPKRKPLVTGTANARTASGVNTTLATAPVATTIRPSTASKTTTKATTVTASTKSTITTTTTTPTKTTPKPTTTTPRPTTTTPRTTKTTTKPTTTTPRPTTTTSRPTTTTSKPTTTTSRPTTTTSRPTTTTPKPTTTTPRSTSTSTRPTTTSMKPTTTALKTTSATTALTSAAETTRVQPATPASVTATSAAPTPATTVNAGLDTSTSSSAYGRTTYDATTGTTSDTAARTTSVAAAQTTSTSPDDQEDKNIVEDTNDDIDTTDDDDKSDNTDDDDTDDEDGEEDVDDTSDGDNNSTATDYIDNGITNAHHSFDTDDNGNNSSPVVDYDRRYKPGDSKVGGTVATDVQDGSEAKAGSVKEGHGGSGTKELLPLIIGVVASVVVGAVVIAGLAYMWARNQRRKREKEEDDQMNIITEYVETTLNV